MAGAQRIDVDDPVRAEHHESHPGYVAGGALVPFGQRGEPLVAETEGDADIRQRTVAVLPINTHRGPGPCRIGVSGTECRAVELAPGKVRETGEIEDSAAGAVQVAV